MIDGVASSLDLFRRHFFLCALQEHSVFYICQLKIQPKQQTFAILIDLHMAGDIVEQVDLRYDANNDRTLLHTFRALVCFFQRNKG